MRRPRRGEISGSVVWLNLLRARVNGPPLLDVVDFLACSQLNKDMGRVCARGARA